ncbi:hypothetical protein J7E71_07695 [Mesobacillus foraminis]|uniref:hypothetical protein n=1 Tax=Mesobacillus foraminis TaxID=279826 RepID=UPI001BE51BC7|nr:hypothetical protein [Mesobacillus foraminis]MBT2755828.1 hypothetical protein [Mesobacillus foraminis]
MNTDEAFELLTDAGVAEDLSIQLVRRWLRERKINYEGTVRRKQGYILKDTDQALNMLMEAGIPENAGIQIVRRWLSQGKIQSVGDGKQRNDTVPKETASKKSSPHINEHDKIIRQLKVRIKAQDEHIKGIEQLHNSSIQSLIQQREKLTKEIVELEKELNQLQKETNHLLKENIHLRNELLSLKEVLSKSGKMDQARMKTPLPKSRDYREKLGLSKTAGHKEVLAGFKQLLKVTHPDHGGNAAFFHYIKSDYDQYRNSRNGE